MVELPYDIWYLIAKHLPEWKVKQLFSVCRPLFELALDLRYKEVVLVQSPPKGGIESDGRRHLIACSSPLIAARPRALHIQLNFVPNITTALAMDAHFGQKIGTLYQPPRRTVKEAVQIIPLLTSVTALHLDDGLGYLLKPNSTTPKLFSSCWAALGSRLTILSLTPSMETFSSIISSDLRLPCLEDFSMLITMLYRSTDVNALIATLLVPFLHSHQSTIHTIHFNVLEGFVDLSALLGPLESMSKLQHLDLRVPVLDLHRPFSEGLRRLFASRKNGLRRLSLNLKGRAISGGIIHGADLFDPKFKCWNVPLTLNQLDLDLPQIYRNDSYFQYISQFASSLTTLKLVSQPILNSFQVASLSSLSRTRLPKLEYLEVRVFTLSADILAPFTSIFTQLDTLHIHYTHLFQQHRGVHDPNDALEYCRAQFQEHENVFATWNLKQLIYEPKRIEFPPLGCVETILLEYLPRVQWFGGRTRNDYRQTFEPLFKLTTEALHDPTKSPDAVTRAISETYEGERADAKIDLKLARLSRRLNDLGL